MCEVFGLLHEKNQKQCRNQPRIDENESAQKESQRGCVNNAFIQGKELDYKHIGGHSCEFVLSKDFDRISDWGSRLDGASKKVTDCAKPINGDRQKKY